MRVTYEKAPTHDLGYIYLTANSQLPGSCVHQFYIEDYQIILDFDKNGYLVGIEMLEADRIMHPELRETAEHPSALTK